MRLVDPKREIIFFCGLFLLLSMFESQAATPTVYKVTMEKMEVQDSDGTWVTVKEADLEVDVASVNAGQTAASYVKGTAIPVGTYNMMKVTVSATFKMQGFEYESGTDRTYFTHANGTTFVNGNVTETSLMPGYGEESITVPNVTSIEVTMDLSSNPMVISKGKTQGVKVSFDVSNTLTLTSIGGGNFSFFPEQPTVEQEFI